MKILYDYSAFTYQKFGGVSKCFCELITRFPSNVKYEIAIKQSDNIHLRESGLVANLEHITFDYSNFICEKNFKGKYNLYHWLSKNLPFFPSADAVNMNYSIDRIIHGDYDIFHPTGFGTYFLPYIGKTPFVYTIHDMTTEIFSSSKGMKKQTAAIHEIAKRAAHIVAVSQNTKNDVMRLVGIPDEKITVIYHGGPNIKDIKQSPIIDTPYFLYVGARQSYKNFPETLMAFARFCGSRKNVKLVCTGPDFNKKEIEMVKVLGLKGSVIHYFASNEELENLYAHALAFVYPSLYEGFGMPILEAYSYGCPVLVSNKSCFPEIAGQAAIYFEADSEKSNMEIAFEKIWNMSKTDRCSLINEGYCRLQMFSWDKAAKQLENVYRSVINK